MNVHFDAQRIQVFYPYHFLLQCFPKEIEFLLSYRNTHENLGELQKLWKHMPLSSCFHSMSHSL